MARTQALRKRNLYTALALATLALTIPVWVNEDGMIWSMWRDAPWLAAALAAVAAAFLVLRARAARD
jgi:hypothetical protein